MTRETVNAENQTTNTVAIDQSCQTTEVVSIGIQITTDKDLLDSNNSYDSNELAKFLNKVLPYLEWALNDSISFPYKSFLNSIQKNTYYTYFEKHDAHKDFNHKQITFQTGIFEENTVYCLAWNCGGVLLAVASHQSTHEGWCNHNATIGLYNTDKFDLESHSPDQLIKTYSCVRCIAFHPYVPSMLAGGFQNGEIHIWDVNRSEELQLTVVHNFLDKDFHTDAVNHLFWKDDNEGVKLVTAGKDGKIIFWKVVVSNLTFKPDKRFVVSTNFTTTFSKTYDLAERIEINAIDFWPAKKSDFVVAAGNKVFHCSSKIEQFVTNNSLYSYTNPVIMSYKSHKGITTCVSCLPNSDLFASSGTDWLIVINKIDMLTPLFVISTNYSVMGIKWIWSGHLSSWGTSSFIENHKINIDKQNVIQTNVVGCNDNILAVAFYLERQRKIAVASKVGVSILKQLSFDE